MKQSKDYFEGFHVYYILQWNIWNVDKDLPELDFKLFLLSICFVAVAATHKETKQFFTLYNTLDDKKVYLEKEVRKTETHCIVFSVTDKLNNCGKYVHPKLWLLKLK